MIVPPYWGVPHLLLHQSVVAAVVVAGAEVEGGGDEGAVVVIVVVGVSDVLETGGSVLEVCKDWVVVVCGEDVAVEEVLLAQDISMVDKMIKTVIVNQNIFTFIFPPFFQYLYYGRRNPRHIKDITSKQDQILGTIRNNINFITLFWFVNYKYYMGVYNWLISIHTWNMGRISRPPLISC